MTFPEPITCPVLVLVGPTAIGKTSLSIEIAKTYNCEIISMDSMQVYRYMDIGTAKVTDEEKCGILHYIIDIRDPDEQYDAAAFVDDCLSSIKKIEKKGAVPLITGGTGLYLKALTQGLFQEPDIDPAIRCKMQERLESKGREVLYNELLQVDPESGARIHKNDTQRLLRALEIYHATGSPWSIHLKEQKEKRTEKPLFSRMLCLGLHRERDELYKRINRRSKLMFAAGLLEEVQKLKNMGYSTNLPSMQAIGYRHAVQILDKGANPIEMENELAKDTRHYAKRQLTWFKAIENIHWCKADDHNNVHERVNNFLNV